MSDHSADAGAISRRTFLAGLGAASVAAGCRAREARRAAAPPLSVPLVYDTSGGLFLDVTIDHGTPVRFILDTGATHSALSSEFARELGLIVVAGGAVEGSAGTVTANLARANVNIPGLGVQSIDFTVYPFASYDPLCVGVLGHEVLSRAPFALRYAERALVWHAARPARTCEMKVEDRIPRIAAEVNGETLELRLDTGAALAPSEKAYVNLAPSQAERLSLTGAPAMVFRATGTGGASLEFPVYRLESLSVAGVELFPALAIVQPRVGYFAREDAVGFLGNSALDKLDPWLDYASGTLGIGREAPGSL